MNVISKTERGTCFEATLPPGDYYVGDPCYVLCHETYMSLLDATHDGDFNNRSNKEHIVLINTPNGAIINWPTIIGDGRFEYVIAVSPTHGISGTQPLDGALCVDSGQLAIIDKRLIDRHDEEAVLQRLSGTLTITEPLDIVITEEANLNDPQGYINVIVDPEANENEERW